MGYFRLAARIHAQAEQRRLLDQDLALFAVGERDRGGTKNLVEQFRVVRNLMEADPPEPDSLSFLILVDDDAPGRGAFGLLESLGFREYRDVLKLCRQLPRTSRNSSEIRKAVQEANLCFKGLEKCEIEDLVSADLLDDFVAQSPGSLKHPARRASNGHHFEWHDHAKPGLLRHVQDHAIRRDVEGLIEFLKSLRYLLRLEPDGVPSE